MRPTQAIAVFALIGSLSSPSFAGHAWTSIETESFVVTGDASEKQIRRVAESLEEFRQAVSRILPYVMPASPTRATVIVFRNDVSYRPFKPLYKGKPANVAGYFQAGEDVNYITLTAGQDTPRVIYHEYVHLLTGDALRDPPLWFSEGLAEYYSTFRIAGKDRNVRIGQVIPDHLEHLRTRSFLPLDVLFSADHGSPYYREEEKRGAFYAQSWALVHYLLLGEGGRRQPQLGLFLDLLSQGNPVEDSVRTAFQTDMKGLQKGLEEYITGQLSFPTLEYVLGVPIEVQTHMPARTLTEAESQFYMGDLLLHSNRPEEAEPYLRAAVTLDPELTAAHAAMGILRWELGETAEALTHLRRAAEKSYSARIHFYYAQLLAREASRAPLQSADGRWMIVRDELRKAIALAPDFVPAVELLAYVSLLQNADLEESELLLRGMLNASPGRVSLMMRLAEVLIRLRERDEARTLLKWLAASPSAPVSMKQRAESLLGSIGSTGS